MKRLNLPAAVLLIAVSTGCAQFSTIQTDRYYDAKTGKLASEKTTHASSYTFFDSKSALTAFKASQTDKTQGASVGALAQEAYGTNAVQAIRLIIEGARPASGLP